MKRIHYIDGRRELAIEIDTEDIELAKILLADKPRIEVIREFIANGYKISHASTLVYLATQE